MQIVIVGHSMGAGIAIILGYILRATHGGRVKCFGYGTPGTVFIDSLLMNEFADSRMFYRFYLR